MFLDTPLHSRATKHSVFLLVGWHRLPHTIRIEICCTLHFMVAFAIHILDASNIETKVAFKKQKAPAE